MGNGVRGDLFVVWHNWPNKPSSIILFSSAGGTGSRGVKARTRLSRLTWDLPLLLHLLHGALCKLMEDRRRGIQLQIHTYLGMYVLHSTRSTWHIAHVT